MIVKINNAIDEILISLAKETYKEEVKKALALYKKPFNNLDLDIDIEHGFNSWLIHDYKLADGTKLARKILKAKDMVEIIESAVYSAFKVHHEKKHLIFKDVFTNIDYVIESDQNFEDGDLICIRIYGIGSKFTVVDNPEFHDHALESTIRKSVMSKYNEYCSSNEPMAIDVFIKEHSQLIYHLTNIIQFYESEMEDEVDLSVYVAEYAVKERKQLLEDLLASDHFLMIESYDDEIILNLLDDGKQIGESVVTHDRLEIETNSKDMLDIAKNIVKEISNGRAIFIKERKLTIDELLQ